MHRRPYIDRNGDPRRQISISIHEDDLNELRKMMRASKRKQLGPFVADQLRQYLREKRRRKSEVLTKGHRS